jgi:hypothetical protein
MIHRRLPIAFRNGKTGVGSLHSAAGVDAWPAGSFAKLVDYVLAEFLLRIGAETDQKTRELLITGEPGNKLIGDRSNRIVAPSRL